MTQLLLTTLSGNQDRLEIAAKAERTERSVKIADAPMNQSREAHHPARPLHSPEGPCTHGRSEPDTTGGLKATVAA